VRSAKLKRLTDQIKRLVQGTETERLYEQRKHLVERIAELEAKNARLSKENQILWDSLKSVQTGSCWCPVGIGNPMMSGHDPVCKAIRDALAGGNVADK